MSKSTSSSKEKSDKHKDFHENYLNSASAKIKNIYIELPEYEYFHSPSGVSRKDKRFIGREKVRKKLKTILSHSFSKAGAYLITGYRGMGKTSMVRSVIAELKEDANEKNIGRLVIPWLFLLLSAFILGLLTYLFLPNIWNGKFIDSNTLNQNNYPNCIHWISWGLIGIILIFLFTVLILRKKALSFSKKPRKWKVFQIFSSESRQKEFWYKWWYWTIKASKREQLLEVETSLSQDNIRDLDFLRLLAKNIQKVYGDFCKPFYSYHKTLSFVTKVFFIASGFLLVYPLFESFFYSIPGKNSHSSGIFDLHFRPIFLIGNLILYIFLLGVIQKLLLKTLTKLGFRTQYEIKRKLNRLVTQIDARTTLEKGKNFAPQFARYSLFQIGRKQRLEYPIASTKEIEFALIDILDDIDSIRFSAHKPKFICVFDELDKIQINVNPQLETEEFATVDRDYITQRIRERRERISNVLANLKHFLNVAKAKFVFIAGREMYDASLADISDRDFFLGSIFHEIVYVESFLKDQVGSKTHGLTNMIERYVCQFLMLAHNGDLSPEIYEKLNLKTFYDWQYRTLEIRKKEADKDHLKKQLRTLDENKFGNKIERDQFKEIVLDQRKELDELEIEKQKLQKVISVLQNFIIYLVYRSNGTPKKLTNHFENFIQKFEIVEKNGVRSIKDKSTKSHIILFHPPEPPKIGDKIQEPFGRKDSESSFFLCFDFNDQYLLGLTAYLFRPYLISSSQYMKTFGDKLLFSTAFLVDHFFKFHSWAFSWKTLEMTPELVFASKSPELRSFIGQLMGSLLRSHIREVVYGIFEYRFYNKTRHEISYISKIREEESAAYNFTLDESMHIKLHFQRRIKKLFKEYGDHPARLKEDYYQSLSFLYSTLGDIFFYDQEFDEAIIAYSEAVAIYSRQLKEGFSAHQLTNWMKDRLKMGLTYERMHSNNDALSLYEGLLSDLDTLLQTLSPYNKAHKIRLAFAKTLFENLRFFQLPFIAKLVLIEKEGISGISYFDILHNQKRMQNILQKTLQGHKAFGQDNKETQEFLIRAYYHLNLGAVLYFKNGSVLHANDEAKGTDYEILYELLLSSIRGKQKIKKGQNLPLSAAVEYLKAFLFVNARLSAFHDERLGEAKKQEITSIEDLLNSSKDWLSARILDDIDEIVNQLRTSSSQEWKHKLFNKKTLLDRIYSNLKSGNPVYFIYASSLWFFFRRSDQVRYINKDKNLYSTISLILSKFGDILLSFTSTKGEFKLNQWQYLFDVQKVLMDESPNDPNSFLTPYLPIDFTENSEDLIYYSAFFYLLAAKYYKKAGMHQNHEFQLRKLLYLIKDYLSVGLENSQALKEDGKEFLTLLKKEVIIPCLKSITQANETTNRPQIFKFKDIFDISGLSSDYQTKTIYNYLSNSPETRETVLLMAEIELKIYQNTKGKNPDFLSFYLIPNFINPHTHYSTKFVRMHELLFKAQCNFALLFGTKIHRQNIGGAEGISLWNIKLAKAISSRVLRIFTKETLTREKDQKKILKHFNIIYIKNFNRDSTPLKRYSSFESLLCESLFCLIEVIKILEVFGINYMTNYSYRGFAHAKLGDWCLLYQAYLRVLNDEDKKDFKEQLQSITEAANINYLEPRYHYELAANHLYACIEMHNSGKAYFQQLEKMYFLEDDFNDNMYHFSAALERYKINIGAIRKKINWLKSYKNLSKTLKYESYINKDDYLSDQ